MYLKANFRCLNFNHFFDKLVKNRNFEFPSSIQSALFITYRSGVLKVNTLYFLRYFDITYFKVFLQKRQKIRYTLYFPL